MTTNELREWNLETDRLRNELNNHLLKFEDLDLLFNKSSNIINNYYKNQSEYKNLNDFIDFLRWEIEFYVKSFSLTREEKKKVRKRIIDIEKKYTDLIYYWDNNSEDNLGKETRWVIWKVTWYFWKILW